MRIRLPLHRILPLLAVSTFQILPGAPATGPLRVSPTNRHWFVDGSGRAVCLAGSHTWQSLQDNGLLQRGAVGNPPPAFDFDRYLEFLARHNHNFIRLWRWEPTKWTDRFHEPETKYCQPHPWMRTGEALGKDGEPRFDLERFNPDYFSRLRTRVSAAGARGVYVSIMLFEGWALQFTDGWKHHPFHAANNINGVEADHDGNGLGLEFNTLSDTPMGRRVLELQERYIRQVIDTVNDLDNVLYEVCNESHGESTQWQHHCIRFIKEYQATKPKQHPVGMTVQPKGGKKTNYLQSMADWVSPGPSSPLRHHDDAGKEIADKVVLLDTDHLWGHTGGDNIWAWRTFMRGMNPLFMEELSASPTWQDSARRGMGQVVRYAMRVNLSAMVPDAKRSTTGYCLSDGRTEFLVFQSDKGEFTLKLDNAPGRFAVEWLDVNADRTILAPAVDGRATRTFTTPFPGPAVLYIKRLP